MSTTIDNEILHLLKYGRNEDAKRYFSEKKKAKYSMEFPLFMDKMLKEHGISRKNVAIKAGLSQDYTYKLLRGDKKTNERDYIIAICMATDPEEACRFYRKSLKVAREHGLSTIYRVLERG